MLFFPNVKINIGLNITEKRQDGYHNIETVFCPAGLSDVLEFVELPGHPSGHAQFSMTGIHVEGPAESNLCIKAYRLLNHDFKLPAVHIHLHKIVPPGAGLGGGSSDAAFMLANLNKHFGLNLTEEKLCEYASQLGSDCAFFILNKPLFGYDRGNRFREIPVFHAKGHIVIVNPGIHISTAEAYAGVVPQKPAESLFDLIQLPVSLWKDKIFNDFEVSIFKKHPRIAEIKQLLYEKGAYYASMSGSGSSVYGLFSEEVEINDWFPGLFTWSGVMK